MMGLKDYIGRAKPDQKSIYYIAADSLAAAANAPFVEQLIKKDLEVCLCMRVHLCRHMCLVSMLCQTSCNRAAAPACTLGARALSQYALASAQCCYFCSLRDWTGNVV